MHASLMRFTEEYFAPDFELILISNEDVICVSPDEGGHEGFEFEDL